MTLGDLLDGAPDVAVYFGGSETRRDHLIAGADALASDLRALGVRQGDVVAVQLANGPATVAALFGVWQAGAVYAPLNPRSPREESEGLLDEVAPAALLTETALTPRASTSRQPDDVALIQFTSGTTGRPKPVPLRHANVLDLLDRVVSSIRGGVGRTDGRLPMPNLVPVSLSVWAGIYQVLFAFRVGAPVVLMERFETHEFVRLVEQFGIRSTVLPPAAMAMLSDDESVGSLGPLKMVRSISAPLSPVQARRFHERFGIAVLNGYGQTELGGEVVGWNAADSREFGDTKLGSVGRPHGGVEVRSDDGELLVRTPATRDGTIAAAFEDRLDADGWFRTGDLGHVDDDGFVWVEGRVSDMINRGGLKVFPAQVEEALMASPAVRDVAVVGVPDERLGEVPWAYVVPVGELDTAGLLAWCRERLSPYKVPAGIVAVDRLPRNDVGKVVRHQLPPPPR